MMGGRERGNQENRYRQSGVQNERVAELDETLSGVPERVRIGEALEGNGDMSLALPLRVRLTINHLPEVGIVQIRIGRPKYHSVEDVEVLDLEFQLDALAEREVLGDGYVLVVVERISNP